jgi:ribosome-associated protein
MGNDYVPSFMDLSKAGIAQEITFKASRSGGKGGQHVNKVSSKVEILFDLSASALFTDEQKQTISAKVQSRLNKDGLIQVVCDEERSQYLNREKAIEKLYLLLFNALKVVKKRRATRPSKSVIAERLENKKQQSAKKQRRNVRFDD